MEYFVNKNAQNTGEHEVHKSTCRELPDEKNKLSLGYFANCHDALKKAKVKYRNADGCKKCCPECNTR